MRLALDGVEVLFLPSAAEHPDRVSLHRTAVDAAAAAGVGRLVYTSFLGAAPECVFTFGRDHFHTEEHIHAAASWTWSPTTSRGLPGREPMTLEAIPESSAHIGT